jgi:hypothetical protein
MAPVFRTLTTAAFTVAVVLYLSVARLSAQDRLVRNGSLFRLVCHFQNAKLADEALGAAELALRGATEVFGTSRASVSTPRDIHLYRHVADYVKREGRVTGGRFRHNLAFSSFLYRNAHIAIQPECTDALLGEIGLPAVTRRQITHEAAHLLCFATLESFRNHPLWYSEGAAMWIADRALRDKGWSPGIEEDPVTSTRIHLVKQMVNAGRRPPIRKILQDDLAGISSEERYALYWLLFTYLKRGDRRARFQRVLFKAQGLAPGSDFPTRLLHAFERAFDEEGYATLDKGFDQFIASLHPEWDEVEIALEPKGRRWMQIAFPDAPAAAWRVGRIEKPSFSIGGYLRILPGHDQAASLLLARSTRGHLAVRFTAGRDVELRAFHAADRRWESLARSPLDDLRLGKKIRFRVVVRKQLIRVVVNRKLALEHTAAGWDLQAPWGVAVSEGSAAEWDSVRLRS